MTRQQINLNNKEQAGCIGIIIGFFVFGIIGLGLGLFYFNPFQAIGLGLISSVVGATCTSYVFYKIS